MRSRPIGPPPPTGLEKNVDDRSFSNVVLEFAEKCLPLLWRGVGGSKSLHSIVPHLLDQAGADHAKGGGRVRNLLGPEGEHE